MVCAPGARLSIPAESYVLVRKSHLENIRIAQRGARKEVKQKDLGSTGKGGYVPRRRNGEEGWERAKILQREKMDTRRESERRSQFHGNSTGA